MEGVTLAATNRSHAGVFLGHIFAVVSNLQTSHNEGRRGELKRDIEGRSGRGGTPEQSQGEEK